MRNLARVFHELAAIGFDLEPVSNAKVVAAVYFKNRLISIGCSQYKTHPAAVKYGKNEHATFLHAEVDAIIKAKKRLTPSELKRSTLVICRPKVDAIFGIETFGIAKPCQGCERCIQDHGIKRVFYSETTDDGSLRYTKMEEIV